MANQRPWIAALRHVVPFCVLMAMLAGNFLFTGILFAQDKSSNRFLFIVETSSGAKPHAAEISKVIDDLLNSGANSQMRDGDTIGLWTFNDQLYSEVPVQTWKQSNRVQLASRVMTFLKQQHFEKVGQFEKILPDMFNVINASDFITVVIVSSGNGKMKGTPFDSEINAQYLQTIKDMKGQRMPVVTVLQAQNGKLLHFGVTAPPWPVVIPPVPVKKPVAASSQVWAQPAETAPATNTVTSQPVVPNLIISKSTVPAPVVTPTPAIAPPVEVPKTEPTPAPTTQLPPPVAVGQPPVVIPAPVTHTTSPEPAPTPKPAPIATVPQSPAVAPPVVAQAKVPEVVSNAPSTAAPVTNSVLTTPMEAVAPVTVERPKTLLLASIGLAVIGLVLIVLMLVRSRASSGPSLITTAISNRNR